MSFRRCTVKSHLFIPLCVLIGWLALSTAAIAQQYMKPLKKLDTQHNPAMVEDADFTNWINNGELAKCQAFAHTAYPEGPKIDSSLNPGKYAGMCYWDIDRAAAIAPPPLSVTAICSYILRPELIRDEIFIDSGRGIVESCVLISCPKNLIKMTRSCLSHVVVEPPQIAGIRKVWEHKFVISYLKRPSASAIFFPTS